VLGSHCKPQATDVPFERSAQLRPVTGGLEIAQLVREDATGGESVPLVDVDAALGLDPDNCRWWSGDEVGPRWRGPDSRRD
jgi:hypothetical protein